jgi:hypothetical protein
MMDIKGDFSGIAKEGIEKSFITERHAKINFLITKFPVEFFIRARWVRLRATVSEFGPVLFSRILDQMTPKREWYLLFFKYCDDNKMPFLI